MALMVTLSCDRDDCPAYEEVTADLADGVSVIETETEGWQLEGGEQFCPEHRDDDDDDD